MKTSISVNGTPANNRNRFASPYQQLVEFDLRFQMLIGGLDFTICCIRFEVDDLCIHQVHIVLLLYPSMTLETKRDFRRFQYTRTYTRSRGGNQREREGKPRDSKSRFVRNEI